MAGAGTGLRATALVAACAFSLHQLRYLIAPVDPTGHEGAAAAHGYLTFALPLLALLAAAAGGQLLAGLARAQRTGRTPRPARSRFARLWLAAAAILLATYVGQELLEAVLAGGHPGLVEVLTGAGGWSVLPLALAGGLLVALGLRGAEAALAAAAGARRRPPLAGATDLPSVLVSALLPPAGGVLARSLAGRSPPPASV